MEPKNRWLVDLCTFPKGGQILGSVRRSFSGVYHGSECVTNPSDLCIVLLEGSPSDLGSKFHQEFQVPKMEVLYLIRLFWVWGFPYISLTYSLHR